MRIETICVCGAGTMGSGIAQLTAMHGFKTIQFDVDDTMLDKSQTLIATNLQKLVTKGKISEEEKHTLKDRIIFTNKLSDCRADLIIEAIVEKEEAKVDLFNSIAGFNTDQTIFATNTSSLSINSIAAKTTRPDSVIGMHFFNPVYVMKLVEVVKGQQTSRQVADVIFDLAKQLGKTPVMCNDGAGFIVNRVARQYYLEAMKLVENGLAKMETVDKIMEDTGFKMGPFALMDLIGNDINYAASCSVYEALEKPERLKPSNLQRQKVENGNLGRKTGKGFYNY